MRTLGIEIFYWIEDWHGDQVARFARARATGYDAVEISLVNGPDINIPAYLDELKRYHLGVYCSMGLPAEMDITSPDATTRQAGIEYLKRCLDTAAKLGSPLLGGLPYAPWLYFPAPEAMAGHRERAADSIREVASVASDLGIFLSLEIINRFETFMFNSVAEGLSFLERVAHPAVRLQLDTYHMNMEEDNMGDAIRAAGKQLGHFHCAASNRKMPGRGHINWPEIRQALDDVNYEGGIVVECFPNPDAETGRTVNTWRPLVGDYDAEAMAAATFLRRELLEGPT